MMRRNRRKRLYVDRPVQGAILWRLLAHWALFFTTALLALTLVDWFDTVTSQPGRSWTEHFGEVFQKHTLVFAVLLSLVPVFLRDTLRLTHRFVGPMIRIRHSLKALAAGEPIEPVKFRKGDYWTELAEMVNEVAERIRRLEEQTGGISLDRTEQVAEKRESLPQPEPVAVDETTAVTA